MVPQLRGLERRFSKELVVLGVHSPKFPQEKVTANLRKAVMRLGITHPVLNDTDFNVWRLYGLRAWPSMLFLDPQGKIFGLHEGEATTDALADVLTEAIREYDAKGLMDRRPLPFQLEREEPGPLSFPGKVLADEKSGRLFIADSNHNRLVIARPDGEVLEVVGAGKATLEDGPFSKAAFNNPQGMALVDNTLYIADTENHAVRKVDLERKEVTTVAGVGSQSLTAHTGGPADSVAISSPWDVAYKDGRLYIAMAGFHQIWELDLAKQRVTPFAGSGAEGIVDGPKAQAQMAQPSGLSIGEDVLYVADSETSSVRAIGLDASRDSVRTIVGVHLFAFGDTDGMGTVVRLQHPLGICSHDGILYLADTYNNKIKRVYPRTQSAAAYLGSGKPGNEDGTGPFASFHEPGGLSVAGGKLYIADTNNHAIRVADLATGQVTTLQLRGLRE
ncbi:MAG: alkyl hydroperoxide reductase [Dehalococcoidia bacterium]|nr:alkyl hydroperoxide reductase [Dehalococcoidia bacterium]